MTFEAALEARIASIALVTARVGNRITWGRRLLGVPAISLFVVLDPRPQHYTGFQAFRPSQVQVDVWAGAAAAAREIRDALIAELKSPALVEKVRFMRALAIATRSSAPQEQGGTTPRVAAELYRESIDITFFHNG